MISQTPRHSVSVSAAVVDEEGRVLVIRRTDNGRWEPPGGVLELDESIHDGLVREVREETGITVEPGPLTGVYKNMQRGIVALVFRCRVVEGFAATTHEAAEVTWLSPAEVLEAMDEAYAVRILDALEALESSGAEIRSHDGIALMQAGPLTARPAKL